MRYLVGFVFVLALGTLPMVGCGDDEVEVCFGLWGMWKKDNPPPLDLPLDPDELLDTYTLTNFRLTVYVGDEVVGQIYERDVASFSGRLEIEETTITSTVTIEGETEILGGPYTTTVEDDQSGVFVISSESYDLRYRYFTFEEPESPEVSTGLSTGSTERTCEMTTLD